jgi:DNA topoisomerase-1
VAAIDRVAEQLNNTRAVCRKYYVHPAVFDTYAAGTMLDLLADGRPGPASRLSKEEQAVVRLLSRRE